MPRYQNTRRVFFHLFQAELDTDFDDNGFYDHFPLTQHGIDPRNNDRRIIIRCSPLITLTEKQKRDSFAESLFRILLPPEAARYFHITRHSALHQIAWRHNAATDQLLSIFPNKEHTTLSPLQLPKSFQ